MNKQAEAEALSQRAAAARDRVRSAKNGFAVELHSYLQTLPRRRKVLIVDDDASWSRALQRGMGVDTEVVQTAPEALHILQTRRFDGLVVDLHLGGVTGMWLIEQVRRRSLYPWVPIVVVTGAMSTPESAESIGKTAGADRVLVKPVLPAEVEGQLVKLMNDR